MTTLAISGSPGAPDLPGPGALSQSEQLRFKISLVHPRLDQAARKFWTHPRLAELYPEFLILVHSMIRSSVPMMEAAAEEAEARAPDDPSAEPLAAYYRHHASEERHHDDWLLDDLEALGVGREEVLRRVPSSWVASLIGAHYYWIHHVHPVALLGYLAVLEGNPPNLDMLQAIRQHTGLPEEAFRTLVKHAHLDPHHRDDLNDEIDRLPLTPELTTLLTLSCFHTVELVTRAFEEILESGRTGI